MPKILLTFDIFTFKFEFILSDQPINECKLVEKYCLDILQLLEKLQAGECTLKGFVEFKLFQCRQLVMDTGKYSLTEVEDISKNFSFKIH